MAKLRRGAFFDPALAGARPVDSDAFRALVHQVSEEEGLTPPRWIGVLRSRKRRANAIAVRFGRSGSGFVLAAQSLVDDLTEDELRFVIRHELAHYRHAESRWAPIQVVAFFSPAIVVVLGMQIASVIGAVPTLIAYVLGLGAHLGAFKSKRFFEERADRESIRNGDDARSARSALAKVSTFKKRREMADSKGRSEVLREFELEVLTEPTGSVRLFNKIWGSHPLVQERLAMYEDIARRSTSPTGFLPTSGRQRLAQE